ncbi:hypothetical protein QBC39DRAFT_407044, partial [Podospora conica]
SRPDPDTTDPPILSPAKGGLSVSAASSARTASSDSGITRFPGNLSTSCNRKTLRDSSQWTRRQLEISFTSFAPDTDWRGSPSFVLHHVDDIPPNCGCPYHGSTTNDGALQSDNRIQQGDMSHPGWDRLGRHSPSQCNTPQPPDPRKATNGAARRTGGYAIVGNCRGRSGIAVEQKPRRLRIRSWPSPRFQSLQMNLARALADCDSASKPPRLLAISSQGSPRGIAASVSRSHRRRRGHHSAAWKTAASRHVAPGFPNVHVHQRTTAAKGLCSRPNPENQAASLGRESKISGYKDAAPPVHDLT